MFDSNHEPKLLLWSSENLIEKFCEQKSYLSGQAGELTLVFANGTPLDRGAVLSQVLAQGDTGNQLLLVRGFRGPQPKRSSINSSNVGLFNPQEVEPPNYQKVDPPKNPQIKSAPRSVKNKQKLLQ